MKKILSMLMALVMVLGMMPFNTYASSTTAAANEYEAMRDSITAANGYGLAETVDESRVLHAWGWSYANIEAKLDDIAEQGFGTILVSPPNEIKMATEDAKFSEPAVNNISPNGWWMLYQPAGFQINQSADNALGTKTEFTRMCTAAHNKGLKIMVEAVVGYMGTDDDYTAEYTNTSTDPKNHLTSKAADFEPEIVNRGLFHSPWVKREVCENYWAGWSDYDIEESQTTDAVDGRPDLATETQDVQDAIYDYLAELVGAGVDGFYFNDAERIETVDDTYYASDFWEDTLERIIDENPEKDIYAIGEIIGKPGDGRRIEEYTVYGMDVTHNEMSELVKRFVTGTNTADDKNTPLADFVPVLPPDYDSSFDPWPGPDIITIPQENSVLWNEQYKTYANGETSALTVAQRNKIWALTAPRKDVTAMYLARPDDSVAADKAAVETVMAGITLGTANETAWANDEVAAVNQFANFYAEEDETLYYIDNVAAIERGGKGAVLVNLSGTTKDVSIDIDTLADGTYKDAITESEFTVANGELSGAIGDTGIAVLYSAEEIPSATYTVTFNANGHGTAPDAINVVAGGSKITAPAAPTADGYVFGGWYKEAECENAWNFETDTVTEDTVLYALWTEEITYTEYLIERYELDHVQSVFGKAAFVTENDGKISIILRSDINGRISFGKFSIYDWGGDFVLDLNGHTINPGELNEAICLDGDFEGSVTITGSGTLKKGRNNTTYIRLDGRLYYAVAQGCDYFTLKTNGSDYFDAENRETKEQTRRDIDYDIDITQYGSGSVNPEDRYAYVEFDSNGGTSVLMKTIEKGSKITAPTAPTKADYNFGGWYKDSALTAVWNFDVDTVAEDVILYAKWTVIPTATTPPVSGGGGGISRCTVKFETNGGSTVKKQNVITGNRAEEPTAPAKAGFKFDGWYTDKALTKVYDFDTKVTKGFTLYAKWTKIEKEPEEEIDEHICPAEDYDDVDAALWYHEDIDYVLENGIFMGIADRTFAPDKNLTRAMLVTVLYRIEGEPATNRSIPFADVDSGVYYANAVSWAQQNGIVTGISDTEFAPDSNITREQMAAIMHRYAQYKGYDVSSGENTNILSYDDYDTISEYAISSMQYACGSGLLRGKTGTTLNPQDEATRAEAAAIFRRFIESNK